jgi:hypothetical protein
MKFGNALVLSGLLTVCAFVGAGCISGTVTPPPVHSSQPSFDGNEPNSGVLFLADTGAQVTPGFVARYNALVDLYGDNFVPPLKKNDGIQSVGNNFRIDKEHLVYFLTMNGWRRDGKKTHTIVDKVLQKI